MVSASTPCCSSHAADSALHGTPGLASYHFNASHKRTPQPLTAPGMCACCVLQSAVVIGVTSWGYVNPEEGPNWGLMAASAFGQNKDFPEAAYGIRGGGNIGALMEAGEYLPAQLCAEPTALFVACPALQQGGAVCLCTLSTEHTASSEQ